VADPPSGVPLRRYMGICFMIPAEWVVSKKNIWVMKKLWKSRHYMKVPNHWFDPQPHMGPICIDDMQCMLRACFDWTVTFVLYWTG
jgi:hypothetical protein